MFLTLIFLQKTTTCPAISLFENLGKDFVISAKETTSFILFQSFLNQFKIQIVCIKALLCRIIIKYRIPCKFTAVKKPKLLIYNLGLSSKLSSLSIQQLVKVSGNSIIARFKRRIGSCFYEIKDRIIMFRPNYILYMTDILMLRQIST